MQKIGTLSIERFRALRELKIEGLGRVNLITGRNNTGKSSVLEALRILAADGSPSVLAEILRYREEDLEDPDGLRRPNELDNLFQMSSLFHGFPQLSRDVDSIRIEATAGKKPMRLILRVEWTVNERPPEDDLTFYQHEHQFGDEMAFPRLVVETLDGLGRISMNFRRSQMHRTSTGRSEASEERHLACVYVSPYGGERTGTLGALWDKIALSDSEEDVVEALRIIDPTISAVSMVGGEGPRRNRTAIVKAAGLPRPVPLRSFGDGLNRLFGIALSLVNAKGGLLLIDEFENSMHHTVQLDAWRAIFRLSKKLDIQVFATSHSWDAIEAFQAAAAEDKEDGVLIRLSRKGDAIVSTPFSEDELAVATREHIEVR